MGAQPNTPRDAGLYVCVLCFAASVLFWVEKLLWGSVKVKQPLFGRRAQLQQRVGRVGQGGVGGGREQEVTKDK